MEKDCSLLTAMQIFQIAINGPTSIPTSKSERANTKFQATDWGGGGGGVVMFLNGSNKMEAITGAFPITVTVENRNRAMAVIYVISGKSLFKCF